MTKVLIGNIQGPPGNEGPAAEAIMPQRQEVTITSPSISAGGRYSSTVDMATAYRLIGVKTSGPSRVRLYIDAAAATADASRALGVDPVGNHKVVSDLAFDVSWDPSKTWYLSPQADAVVPTGISVPFHIDNLSATPAVITVILTFIRTE